MSLTELSLENYHKGYNCAEAIIHACNTYYDLDLHDEDMKMMAGFGSGLYSGLTCGALCASIACLSKLLVETKAHDHLDTLRPYSQKIVASFNKKLEGTQCAQVKAKHYSKEKKCEETVRLASESLEETLKEISLGA